MQTDADLPLNGTADEAAQHNFARVVRGYDPRQVNDYLQQMSGELGQHYDRIQDLEKKLLDANRQIESLEQRVHFGLGARIEQVLRYAEDQAVELLSAAQSAADEMTQSAKTEAAELRTAAESEAAQLRTSAQRETQELTSAAEREVSELRQRAAEAGEQAMHTRRYADKHSRQLLGDAKRNADRMLAQANKLLAEAKAEADRVRSVAQRQVDELSRQKENISVYLAEISQVLGPAAPAQAERAKADTGEPAAGDGQLADRTP